MIGENNYIPVMIHTQRGIIDIKDVVSGDMVYEYKSNKKVKVLGGGYSKIKKIYQVNYTDSRIGIYTENDNIFDGNKIISIESALLMKTFHEIIPYPFEYDDQYERPNPDPCVAGALIIHGRYDTPYINLPLDRSGINQLFAHKYNLDYADYLEDNTTFYQYNGCTKDTPITWKEFFSKYDFYSTSKRKDSPLIPEEYIKASLIDRKKFIRGVFDVGYNADMFPDNVGIANPHEYRLKEVQRILWSIGILSNISYDPNLPYAKGRIYRLDIIGSYHGHPGFFYDINNIRNMIQNDNRWHQTINSFQMKIQSIEPIHTNGYTVENGVMYNIICERPNVLYMTADFLPRVSL